MATIEHANTVDLRDLAELARECGEEIADTETYDAVDREEAADTLKALASLCGDLGRMVDEDDAEAISDALEALSDETSGGLIAEDHFVDYCKELVSDIGDLPDNLPGYIENNIDWDGVADDLKVDYSSYTLDGEDYYLR